MQIQEMDKNVHPTLARAGHNITGTKRVPVMEPHPRARGAYLTLCKFAEGSSLTPTHARVRAYHAICAIPAIAVFAHVE